MVKNCPNILTNRNLEIQEVQCNINMINSQNKTKTRPRHILDKENKLKAAREKWHVTYKGFIIQMIMHFSSETQEARRQWNKSLKNTNLEFFPGKISFRMKEKENIFRWNKNLFQTNILHNKGRRNFFRWKANNIRGNLNF